MVMEESARGVGLESVCDGYIQGQDHWGGPGVMIWGAVGLSQRLGPVLFSATLVLGKEMQPQPTAT